MRVHPDLATIFAGSCIKLSVCAVIAGKRFKQIGRTARRDRLVGLLRIESGFAQVVVQQPRCDDISGYGGDR